MKITLDSNIVRHMLRNAYFINGTAYAGKSTMVRMLAEKHDGIFCGENYHDVLMDAVDPRYQPNLGYFQTMRDWQEFVNRTPEEYDQWIRGCSEEAAQLELIQLMHLARQGKKMFVDTNIAPETLHHIADEGHVAIMVAQQSTSVERFFDRSDPEKRFILDRIAEAEDPQQTMANYRACLARINSLEVIEGFRRAGFMVVERDDSRTPEETMRILEQHFGLV